MLKNEDIIVPIVIIFATLIADIIDYFSLEPRFFPTLSTFLFWNILILILISVTIFTIFKTNFKSKRKEKK